MVGSEESLKFAAIFWMNKWGHSTFGEVPAVEM